ncbi:Hypothetical predicted protein [Olea europaea subsp. europaea]|uniref:Uncharacterized protein n=1 Tax=Olea europaea subsp. europaea TaxID=158383 RepID=A0A8S0QSD8_OLEEU|nr:Hypothetical predicted protein [Olea europaea subsp. europaea]
MRPLRSRPAMDQWGLERNQSVASSANAIAIAPHGRFDSSLYHDKRPLSYDMDSYYRYGERIRYRDHDAGRFTRVENLENGWAELLRKLDELKDQLTRSCDLGKKPNGLGTDRWMPKTPLNPYGRHHATSVQEGLTSSHGVNQKPLGPSYLKTIYSSYDRGHIPHITLVQQCESLILKGTSCPSSWGMVIFISQKYSVGLVVSRHLNSCNGRLMSTIQITTWISIATFLLHIHMKPF